jgi:16S rRNA (adenine1518-N6/adenine1519-N6)-dimethyltransferase
LTPGELRSEAEWRALIRRHGLRPDKRLGQHFLFDPDSLKRIVSAAEPAPGEAVLEIGAGAGSLTCALAEAADRVVALEIDRRIEPLLAEATAHLPGVTCVHADVLSVDLSALVGEGPYLVVGNIPYNVTSAVIRRLMEAPRPARRVVLTVQAEVARRVVAGPGQMSMLSLSVQLYGEPSIVFELPRGKFHPPPEVDSAVLRIDTMGSPRLARRELEAIFVLARAGFGQRRKQLKNSLSKGMGISAEAVAAWLEQAGIEPSLRAQNLDLGAWNRLAQAYLQRAGEAR